VQGRSLVFMRARRLLEAATPVELAGGASGALLLSPEQAGRLPEPRRRVPVPRHRPAGVAEDRPAAARHPGECRGVHRPAACGGETVKGITAARESARLDVLDRLLRMLRLLDSSSVERVLSRCLHRHPGRRAAQGHQGCRAGEVGGGNSRVQGAGERAAGGRPDHLRQRHRWRPPPRLAHRQPRP
jgi:hypothetical protein